MTLYGAKANTFEIKRGDTSPRIGTTLLDENGPVNLTSATSVKLVMRLEKNPRTLKLNRVNAGFTADTSGTVWYDWQAGDTNTVGRYEIEWVVIFPGGKESTYPSKGYDYVEVTADLDS